MITVTIARKPVTGTLTGNVSLYGTGGFNILASRIKLEAGTELAHRGSNPANRKGEVGRDLGFSSSSLEKMLAAQKESIDRTNTLGRWPANVVLEGLAGDSFRFFKQVGVPCLS